MASPPAGRGAPRRPGLVRKGVGQGPCGELAETQRSGLIVKLRCDAACDVFSVARSVVGHP